VNAEAVAEATEHPHEEHGGRLARAAQIIEMADVEALMEPAFDAQGTTLTITQSGRELFQILLPAGCSAEVGQKDNGQQAPERVEAGSGSC